MLIFLLSPMLYLSGYISFRASTGLYLFFGIDVACYINEVQISYHFELKIYLTKKGDSK